ncbi:hypothetical protein VPH35_128796 [Triticum aestivum]
MDSSGASSSASEAEASSSSSSALYRYPDWVLLGTDTLIDPDDHFHATSAGAITSKGEPIHVSFRAVPPPGVSSVYVRWTRGNRRSEPLPSVAAAHRNSILLKLRRGYNSKDLFVYTASSTGPTWLRLLPAFERNYYDDDYGTLCRKFSLNHIDLLCDGGGEEFVVAELKIEPKSRYFYGRRRDDDDTTPVEAALLVFRSSSPGDNWKATQPRIRHKKGQGEELASWSSDETVPYGDSLCYVDYSRGVFFVDVLSECPELRYVSLPVKIPTICPYGLKTLTDHSQVSPGRCRRLCVTDGGRTMKFVEVVTTTAFMSRGRATASALFTINVWRLRREGKSMTWEKESHMEDSELWTQQGYGDLPRVAPTWPRVSMGEPNVIYLTIDADETWVIIVVDMLTKTLRSSFRYTRSRTQFLVSSLSTCMCLRPAN